MESAIDRKEYRRNQYDVYEKNKTITCTKKKSNTLNQIINALMLLLSILLVKLFGFENEFEFLKKSLDEGIPYEEVSEFVIENIKIVYEKFKTENKENIESNVINVDITSGENESGESIEEENKIEEKNETMTDAECAKNIYGVVSPLKGMITSKFGNRVSDNPIVSAYHTGLDIGANTGTLINAAHDGIVIQAGDNGTYGKSVTIESGDLQTIYAHCSSILVKKGSKIKKGESIAKVGMTGNATGPHLHFEIRYQGRFVNPEDVI